MKTTTIISVEVKATPDESYQRRAMIAHLCDGATYTHYYISTHDIYQRCRSAFIDPSMLEGHFMRRCKSIIRDHFGVDVRRTARPDNPSLTHIHIPVHYALPILMKCCDQSRTDAATAIVDLIWEDVRNIRSADRERKRLPRLKIPAEVAKRQKRQRMRAASSKLRRATYEGKGVAVPEWVRERLRECNFYGHYIYGYNSNDPWERFIRYAGFFMPSSAIDVDRQHFITMPRLLELCGLDSRTQHKLDEDAVNGMRVLGWITSDKLRAADGTDQSGLRRLVDVTSAADLLLCLFMYPPGILARPVVKAQAGALLQVGADMWMQHTGVRASSESVVTRMMHRLTLPLDTHLLDDSQLDAHDGMASALRGLPAQYRGIIGFAAYHASGAQKLRVALDAMPTGAHRARVMNVWVMLLRAGLLAQAHRAWDEAVVALGEGRVPGVDKDEALFA